MSTVFVVAGSAAARRGLVGLLTDPFVALLPGSLADPVPPEAELVLAELQRGDHPHIARPAWVVLSDEPDAPWVRPAWSQGLRALLPTRAGEAEIRAALVAAELGLAVVSPDYLADGAHPPPTDDTLTSRERDVLVRIGGGLGNKQIAAELGISEHTVKFHLTSIFNKLGVSSRAEAVAAGLRRGLVWI